MILKELWEVAPQSHIFIKKENGKTEEYLGEKDPGKRLVESIHAVHYPMFPDTLEVKLKEDAYVSGSIL